MRKNSADAISQGNAADFFAKGERDFSVSFLFLTSVSSLGFLRVFNIVSQCPVFVFLKLQAQMGVEFAGDQLFNDKGSRAEYAFQSSMEFFELLRYLLKPKRCALPDMMVYNVPYALA